MSFIFDRQQGLVRSQPCFEMVMARELSVRSAMQSERWYSLAFHGQSLSATADRHTAKQLLNSVVAKNALRPVL